jgi:hypothetical protein
MAYIFVGNRFYHREPPKPEPETPRVKRKRLYSERTHRRERTYNIPSTCWFKTKVKQWDVWEQMWIPDQKSHFYEVPTAADDDIDWEELHAAGAFPFDL